MLWHGHPAQRALVRWHTAGEVGNGRFGALAATLLPVISSCRPGIPILFPGNFDDVPGNAAGIMQQRNNFWLFLLLSTVILLGWIWFQSQFGEQSDAKKEDQKAEAKPDENKPDEKKPEDNPPPVEPPPAVHNKTTKLVAAAVSALGLNQPLITIALAASAEETARALIEPDSTLTEVATCPLGGDGFYLNAMLTTRGAGVQRLTLTKFQAASWIGLPETTNDNKPVPLELIPDDPIKPSFLMFHYPDPTPSDQDNARPDTTLGERIWKLEKKDTSGSTQHTVVFSTPGPPGYESLTIRKTYTLHAHEYHIDLKIDIEDTKDKGAGERKKFRYQLAGAHGLPIEGGWYTSVFRNALMGVVNSNNVLFRTLDDANKVSYLSGGERVPGPKVQYAAIATQFFTSAVVVSDKQEASAGKGDFLDYARATHESEEKLCFWDGPKKDGKHEIRLVDDRTKLEVELLPRAAESLAKLQAKHGDQLIVNLYRVYRNGNEVYVAEGFRDGTTLKPYLEDISVRVVSNPLTVSAGETITHQFLLYHGPVKVTQLSYVADKAGQVDPALVERYANTLHLSTLTDYPSTTWFAWWSDIIILFTRFMHWLLNLLFTIVPIPGITIILLTGIVRGLMFPISRKQAMTAMRMQELAPELKRVQEKYKNDVQARNQAVMELYRKHNVNPLGGCLPILLQLPIFLGLYFALQESIRFRLAEFLWMRNLAAPDMLIYWSQSIPIISDPNNQGGADKSFFGSLLTMFYLGPYFNILPVLAVAIMLVSQKMMMPPAQDEQQATQQKMMTYMLVFMGLLFYKVAAGLSIYFIATTLWGIAERKFLPKKRPIAPATDGEPPTPPGNAGPRPPQDLSKLNPAQRRKLKAKIKKQEQQPDTTLKKVRDWWEEVLKQAKKK
jgi:YidC/Oxa1 family membrane protein insertase